MVIPHIAKDLSGIAPVPRVENTAQFLIVIDEGIGFVDQKRRVAFVDDSEDDGGQSR